ncbi:hypothetical protein BKA62DRAFT_775289 [Auriculariales sp. MPI-PUGE-AT-0066]|nr:hypothetical protein BKA62DRAFT_775289 [Auriculariales sp. MPI-PUGE-AT-0066]
MGGFDSCCFVLLLQICGSNARVSASLHSPFQSHEFPEGKTKHFLLNDEDEAFAEDLVSVGPYDEQNRPIINAMEIYRGALPAEPREAARLEAIDPITIRLVDGLAPGEFHQLASATPTTTRDFSPSTRPCTILDTPDSFICLAHLRLPAVS